jgi:hypothetical protein
MPHTLPLHDDHLRPIPNHLAALPIYLRALIPKPSRLADGATIPFLRAHLPPQPPDPEHLRRYRAMCALPPNTHKSLPLTYPHLLATPLHAYLLGHRAFPLSALGVVHLRNTIHAWAPIPDDAPLAISAHVRGHRRWRHHIAFDLITHARIDGALIWRQRSTVLSLQPRPAHDASLPTQDTSPEPPTINHHTIYERWALPTSLGLRYSMLSLDLNPIHIHPWLAKLFGKPRHIIHGMWSAGRALGALHTSGICHQLHDHTTPLTFEANFMRPLQLPASSLVTIHPDAPDGPHLLARSGPAQYDAPHLLARLIYGAPDPHDDADDTSA